MAASILVVEDDQSISQALVELLSLEGYFAVPAFDGYQGIELAGLQKFNLILLDILMPGMGGIEFLNKIKQADFYSKTPVIVLTATRFSEKTLSICDIKSCSIILKPIDADHLLSEVRSALEKNNLSC